MAWDEITGILNRCRLKSRESSENVFSPLTLFPFASRRGENTATPIWPGRTPRTPPPTPLLAGRPTVKIHSPE